MATFCVAFGATELKADFETDLRNVCKKCKINPTKVRIFLESYKCLYQEFKDKVVVKMRKLHNLRLKGKKIVDDGSVFCPGNSEIEILQFAKWLWKQVESVRQTALQSTCSRGVLDKECYDAFMRHICNFGFACIRFFAGRFASEKMLFDEKDIESEEKIIYILESIPATVRHYIRENVFRNEIHFPRLLMICDRKKYEEPDWEEYIQGIYKRCCSISDYAKDCRLCLTKLSDQDFDEINVLFESVKDVDRLWEIDKLKEEKERVSHELDRSSWRS